MRKGILKFFNLKKGFGFIRDSETGEDFFVRHQSLPVNARHKRLPENIAVTFEVAEETDSSEKDVKKLRLAINVKIHEEERKVG